MAASLLSLTACAEYVNYTEDDLDKYISVSESDYRGFLSSPDFRAPTDAEIERQIMNLLFKNKDAKPQYNGGNVTTIPISVGDTAYIYYRGYTVDENGTQKDIDGASNFSSSIYPLEIGSLSFIEGFEESLIGKIPADYERFERKDSGTVDEGDVIYLTYSALYPDGSSVSESEKRIDLSLPGTDAAYGEGFAEFFVGKEIATKTYTATFKHTAGDAVYYDMKIGFATSCEGSPLTVDARFPEDYREQSLRGVNAKFDVYIRYSNVYNVPEYNDAFITDKLKFTEEELSEYEGSSLTERHRASIEYSLTEEAFWDYIAEKVTVKKLPKKDVTRVYEEYYYEIISLYDTYYSASFSSVAEFAAQYYQLPAGTDWLDYITERAEEIIIEKLTFYYITRKEGFLPTGEEYERLYEECVSEYLEYYSDEIYKAELDKLTDPLEKEKRLLEIKEEMLDYYGEEYFDEMVYYDHSMKEIIALGK